MSKISNDYLSIANRSYEFATKHRDPEFCNELAVQCQQVIERLLKSVIEKTVIEPESLLRSHNLRNLYNSVKEELNIDSSISVHLSMITDFYFDERYPGDDFTEVSEEELEICFMVMKTFYEEVNAWHHKNNKRKSALDVMLEDANK